MTDIFEEDFLQIITKIHFPTDKGIVVIHIFASETANVLTNYVDQVRIILPNGQAIDPWTAGPKVDPSTVTAAMKKLPYFLSNLGPGFMSGTFSPNPGQLTQQGVQRDQFVFINLGKFKASNGKYAIKLRQPAHKCLNENVQWFVAWDTGSPATPAGPPTKYIANLIGADGSRIPAYDQIAANAAIAASGGGSLICGAIFETEADAATFAAAHGLTGLYYLTQMYVGNRVSTAGIQAANVGCYTKKSFVFDPGFNDKVFTFHFPVITEFTGGTFSGISLDEDPDNWLLAPMGYLPGGIDPSGFGFEANYSFGGSTTSNGQTDHILYFDAKTFILTRGNP